MLPFGQHLLAVDETNILKVWDINAAEISFELNFNPDTFSISAMIHPVTYLNKILFGSIQGSMQLWNLKTGKMVFAFNGWKSQITILEQAPAVDVVAVGAVALGDTALGLVERGAVAVGTSAVFDVAVCDSVVTDVSCCMFCGFESCYMGRVL